VSEVGRRAAAGDRVVAWAGAGTKAALPARKTKLLSPLTAETWCVGCLTERATHRGGGLAEAIVAAVVAAVGRARAAHVVAYPVRPSHDPCGVAWDARAGRAAWVRRRRRRARRWARGRRGARVVGARHSPRDG
jgi:hypothetical protein